MDVLVWGLVGAAVPLALLAGMQLWMKVQTGRRVGTPAPSLSPPLSAHGPALVYFFSPTCGPCRVMAPSIDALAADGKSVVKVNVTRDLETAQAWNVLATPTTVAVLDGQIREVMLGVVSKARLEALLTG